MNNGDSWDESRKFVLNELDRIGDCAEENAKAIGVLTTRLAVLWAKVSLIAGGIGSVGLIAKSIYDSIKR